MQAIAQTTRTEKLEYQEIIPVNTTLYELIEAISKEVDPVEDRLVPVIVSDLLDRGLIMLPDSMKKSAAGFSIN